MFLNADATSEIQASHLATPDDGHRLDSNSFNALLGSLYLASQFGQFAVFLLFRLRSGRSSNVGNA